MMLLDTCNCNQLIGLGSLTSWHPSLQRRMPKGVRGIFLRAQPCSRDQKIEITGA